MIELPDYLLETAVKKRNKRPKIRRFVSNWKPHHTHIVHLHLEGKSVDEIAEETGFNLYTIHNILRTPEAVAIQKAVHAKILERGMQSLPEKMAAIQFQALENVQEFISNKDMAKKNPFAFYDRSVKAVEMISNMQKKAPDPVNPTNNTQINNFIVSPEQQKALTEGLGRALQAAKMHEVQPTESVGNLKSLDRDG